MRSNKPSMSTTLLQLFIDVHHHSAVYLEGYSDDVMVMVMTVMV